MQGATEAAHLCTDKEALTQTYFYFSSTVQRCMGLPDCGVILILWWFSSSSLSAIVPMVTKKGNPHGWAYLVELSGRDSCLYHPPHT